MGREKDNMNIIVTIPFTVRVVDNKDREELSLNRLYTVVGVAPDLINSDVYGFRLLEQQPEEPYDSYMSTRFINVDVIPN